jgi:hypothetical protein
MLKLVMESGSFLHFGTRSGVLHIQLHQLFPQKYHCSIEHFIYNTVSNYAIVAQVNAQDRPMQEIVFVCLFIRVVRIRNNVSEVRTSSIIRAMMEAVRTSETSVYFNETTRHYMAEGCHIHACRR